ncbi:DNA cytosine methyltransferase [Parasphingorhabdus sp.]|uniref:DNA cytosine methyltransferase n=1 Tax=Parasphingorhabdus sp. TaxID=2709688 RepID=UPI0032EBDD83
MMKAIDLFCGCGGMSLGLRRAGLEVIAGMDIEPNYMATFAHNFGNEKAFKNSIATLCAKEFMSVLNLCKGELDILVGGPPCQGFSKNVPRKHRHLEDPKNQLVRNFLDYVEAFMPRFVVMENVAEMKNGFENSYSDEVMRRLSKYGYSVEHGVLNAADFGVPQRRRRAFFVASRDTLNVRLPQPSHKKATGSDQSNLFGELVDHVNIKQAIYDLPRLEHGQGIENASYRSDPISSYQQKMRGECNLVKNHIARELKPLQFERISSLKPGQGLKDLPAHLKTKGGYSGAYGRLTWDMIAPTITRWVFHPGSGRWGHPEDLRLLTIREVARVQSFSDDYTFIGSYNQQAGQLGNAVPPLLMESVVNTLVYDLYDDNISSRSSSDILLSGSGNLKETA